VLALLKHVKCGTVSSNAMLRYPSTEAKMQLAKSIIRDFPALDSRNSLLNGCVSEHSHT